jgi:hypothetical protein
LSGAEADPGRVGISADVPTPDVAPDVALDVGPAVDPALDDPLPVTCCVDDVLDWLFLLHPVAAAPVRATMTNPRRRPRSRRCGSVRRCPRQDVVVVR